VDQVLEGEWLLVEPNLKSILWEDIQAKFIAVPILMEGL
jgi:hypothetical protein